MEMSLEQSMAEANRILRAAGWHAHPDWGGEYVRVNLVGGIQPDKQGCHFKDWTKIPPGHPLYSADTPDEPHEAATWLVRLVKKSEQRQNIAHVKLHEMRGEAHPDALVQGGEASAQLLQGMLSGDHAGEASETQQFADRGQAEGEHASLQQRAEAEGEADPGAVQVLWEPNGGDASSGLHESEAGGVALSGLSPGGPLPEGDDFASFSELDASELTFETEMAEAEAQAGGSVAYFGDDFPTMKLKKIGRLTQLALEKAEAVLAEARYDDAEHATLQNGVMRDTIDGIYRGPQADYDRFVELSDARSQANTINHHRDQCAAYLNHADTPRLSVEQFDPEHGWP